MSPDHRCSGVPARTEGESLRKPRARSGRPATKSGIAGAAALLGAAALVVSAVPGQALAAPAGSDPAEVIPGTGTSTPSLVDGIREGVKSTGSAADAARGHLADKKSRYRIADPGRDLKPVQTLTTGASETVRLQQKHRGIDVLGGQYVVRMEKKDGKRVVTGTSGKYFTALKADTKAEVGEELAVQRAVNATLARIGGKKLDKSAVAAQRGLKAAPRLTGTARGLVVLPKGAGVLAHHVTVRGTDPASGEPVLREVYIDAKAGYPVLQYSAIKTFGASAAAPAAGASEGKAGAGKAPEEAGRHPGVAGSGVKLDGSTVELGLYFDTARGEYLMRDHARMWDSSKNLIATWDAHEKDANEASGRWPEGIKEFGSKSPQFPKEATEAGAVDAHWAAGKVYDYYKKVHGRDSLDGRGMTINSLVGVTFFGMPYVNAFWDGTKMVYGSGDKEYKTLSADLDVVGHEMTHGVVENTAGLVYAGQSGALNEAIADYFGNAIAVDAAGMAMDHPDAGLLGGDLCRTKSPRQCAIRDLNDGATTSKNFLGVSFANDNGGVHLNSTIFSGALWDIREDLGRTLADKIAYKALSEYMTPLDGFTEGRNAVLSAAKALKISAKDMNVVKRSFNAHGIVPNWEEALGVDTDRLFGRLNTADTTVGAGGGWWSASKSNDDGTEAYSVWAGRTDGKGSPKLMSPNDGRFHVNPATDGKSVVWEAYGPAGVEVLSRPLAGGPVKKLYVTTDLVRGVRVEGAVVTFETMDSFGARHAGYLRTGDKEPTWVDGRKADVGSAVPSIGGGRIAYAKAYPEGDSYRMGVEVLDLASGGRTLMPQLGTPQTIGQTAVTGKHVYWLADEVVDQGQTAVRRANVDGTGVVDLSKEKGDDALYASDLTASEAAVTVTAQLPDVRYRNESMAKLWQFGVDGGARARVSCNRGEQAAAAAAGGKQVVWLDGTTGYTDLVTRTRPAGNCG
ncbi:MULTISPECIES: M4 family metallopeptidase [Streptomyces]|uniref:M4 family metallopeptidase n=1 Tax=Streptomyces griseocarneus TaxID=51201 RepID=A0ABX7RS33_9ACTN|nr:MULTISPECIES: M4 family metallopeptidase [Streptomyces]QSY51080.1 M4 family metallopeptidase [Streptomyces griseocarneus]